MTSSASDRGDDRTESPAARRLFFALWPDEHTRAEIRENCRAAVRQAGGRAVPAHNYHITLAFLGNQPVTSFGGIVSAGWKVAAGWVDAPLDIELDRFGYWPKPRVFWLGPSGHREPLAQLAQLTDCLWSALESLGIPRERRPLMPHVTLCRKVQRAPRLELSRPVRWRATDFALVESVTASSGAEYTVVAQFSRA